MPDTDPQKEKSKLLKQYIVAIGIVAVCALGMIFLFFPKIKARLASEKSIKSVARSAVQDIQDISPQTENPKDELSVEQNQPLEDDQDVESASQKYFLHKNITSTIFWVGEKASDANKDISNSPSAWDEKWKKHFGGTDTSQKRNGFYPAGFVPKENPFYVALPFNDFDRNGKRKANLQAIIPWVGAKQYSDNESICKNRWVKIAKAGKIAYAQWEDVGPFKENDEAYVFGSVAPASKTNKNSGIDVSPAVRDFLGLDGIDKVDWQFAEASDVPDGPWKNIITTSQIDWN
jgi:hypothetical protein